MAEGNKFVSFDEFANYLDHLGSDHHCPMCDGEAWMLITPHDLPVIPGITRLIPNIPYMSVIDDKGKRGRFHHSTGFDLLVMQCATCGFLRFFSHNFVRKKLGTLDVETKVDCDLSEGGENDKS